MLPQLRAGCERRDQPEAAMERVRGIGGVFFKARGPGALRGGDRRCLGFEPSEHGFVQFAWRRPEAPDEAGSTLWSLFPQSSNYFEPTSAPFMLNYRVDNLDAMLAQLRAQGAQVENKIDDSEYGRFGW